MQSFKIAKQQISSLMRDYNNQRKESIKSIKSFYAQISSKQANIFDSALDRLQKNIQYFKQDKYKKMHNQINYGQMTQKYQVKLERIDNEILKLDKIIKNGCGKIVEKPLTSRISLITTNNIKSPLISKRSSRQDTDGKLVYLSYQNQVSRTSLEDYQNYQPKFSNENQKD